MHRILRHRNALNLISAAVGGVLISIGVNLIKNVTAGEVANSTALLSLTTIVVLLLVVGQQVLVREEVISLSRRTRFSVAYYPADSDQDIEELHRQATKVIQRAPLNAAVYAVNSYVEVFRSPDESARLNRSARSYLAEYEKRFADISYERLIQVEPRGNGNSLDLKSLLNDAYLAHYLEMAEHAQKNVNNPIQLVEVQPSMPISFVLVKSSDGGGEIIWQIHRHARGDAEAVKMLGILIITDPDGQLVPTFEKWFAGINRGQRHELTPSDLGAGSVAGA